ncbi:MAG: MFS transporter [Gammaproteobacteria bacterium]
MTTVPAYGDDRRAKHNVAVLFFAQAVLGSQLPINIILGGLAGFTLAENKALATLPISVMVLVSMFTAAPASLFMGRFGRRLGFLAGAAAGVLGGMLSALALLLGRFDLLLLGGAFTGIYQSTHGFFRFAAADTASEAFRPKAISWVLAGGLLAALIAPEVIRATSGYFSPIPFAGAYAAVIGINLVGGLGMLFLDIPTPPRRATGAPSGRALAVIFSQPKTLVAVICAMVSYALMVLVMTATSLAMDGHGFSTGHAADVVRWHLVAMFGPSFFTGSVISRFGHLRVITLGLVLLGVAGAIAVGGVGLENFYLALIALGLGWNFGFIGATSLLGTTHTSEEQAKVQGLNDFLVFGLVTVASFCSGALLHTYGWTTVQLAMVPALAVAGAAVLWLAIDTTRSPTLSGARTPQE